MECFQKDVGVNAIQYLKQNNEIINPTFLEVFRNDFSLECLDVNRKNAFIYFNLCCKKQVKRMMVNVLLFKLNTIPNLLIKVNVELNLMRHTTKMTYLRW